MKFEIIKKYKVDSYLNKKLYFYHVPKCAGQSIVKNLGVTLKSLNAWGWSHQLHKEIIENKNYIEDFYRKKEKQFPTVPVTPKNYTASNFYNLTKSCYSAIPFCFGHTPYTNYINSDNRFTFTVLREPISRAISNYYFWIKKGFIDKKTSIEMLYDKKILEPNLMTKFFSSFIDPSVENAIENLKKIDLVTNTENISNLMGYLISHWNLPNVILTKLNNTQEISNFKIPNSSEIFSEYNKDDLVLFKESSKLNFDFNSFSKDKQIENEQYYSIFTDEKIFNNSHKLIFKEKDLTFVTEALSKI
jgi:hypothetical protein